MTKEQKQLTRIMTQLRTAYNLLDKMLPETDRQQHLGSKGEDKHSKQIYSVVKEVFGLDPMFVGRKNEVIYCRHAYRYLLRKHSPRSLESIAQISGTFDHKSVSNSLKIAKNLIETDEKFALLIKKCEEKI